MADLPIIEQILENEIELCCAVNKNEMASSQNIQLKELDLEIIDSVCTSLSQNCVLHSARDFFKQASRSQLLDKMGFLNACLVHKTKLPHSDREKSWGNFHKANIQNMGALNSVTGSPMISSWLTLRCFECLLNKNYLVIASSTNIDNINEELSEDILDIVNYIGGSIITKMKQRLQRGRENSSKEEQLLCLAHLTQEDDGVHSLTSTLNRGGLVFLKPATKYFFHLLEKKTLEVFTLESVERCRLVDFQTMCSQDSVIASAFSGLTYEAESAEDNKEAVFEGIVRLYFKVRVHHECRQYMEKQKLSAVFAKKSLRKTLKSNSHTQ
ncbi:uncharacterized protein LOC112565662 [Pomacea canaliculata]|uniref:uncharacterized protein LOC112565662 n=1 Tax=Pomacea canaliculata TaxID=400727 RepID=UPI000D73D0CC|nr:uncharacterized protein LOC112565662 [Pomacea canaliculata]